MTKQDLENAGIIDLGEISSSLLSYFLLKYNRLFLDEKDIKTFDKLAEKVQNKFKENQNEEYLKNCLAICCKEIQLCYLKGNDDAERIILIHNLISQKIAKDFQGKENIRKARALADACDAIKIQAQKYIESKKQYDYIHSCITEEDVFERFYKNIEGRLTKDSAKQMLEVKFIDIKEKFLKKQEKYLDFFINYQISEDARVIGQSKIC